MVSYGDEGFRQWAEENDFNDSDLALIQKTVSKNAWKWFIIAAIGYAFLPLTNSANMSGVGNVSVIHNILLVITSVCFMFTFLVGMPFLLESWHFSKILRSGSFDVRPGFFWKLFYLEMFITFISIIPLVVWKLTKKNLWGTGIKKLAKKGLIGNH